MEEPQPSCAEQARTVKQPKPLLRVCLPHLAMRPIQHAFAPQKFAGSRFFHDGVRLQAGKIVSAISQLRELACICDGCYPLRDTARAADHADHLAPQGQQRRHRSSSGNQRRRPSEQQRRKRQDPPTSSRPPSQMLPATILLAYDSCSSESKNSALFGNRREDESDGPSTKDKGGQTPGQSRRRALSGKRVPERREVGYDETERREGGRCGMQVRVVEFKPDRVEGSQHERIVCRGLGQVRSVFYPRFFLRLFKSPPPVFKRSPLGDSVAI